MGRPLRVRLGLIRRAVLTFLTIIISMEFYIGGGRLSNEVMGRLWLPFRSDRLEIAQRKARDRWYFGGTKKLKE